MAADRKKAIQEAYRQLFTEKAPVIKGGWSRFMSEICHDHWDELWLDDELYTEAAEILGIPADDEDHIPT